VSGLARDDYLGRWLLLSAGLFALAAVAYLSRGRGGGSRS
jgi:hypothetical protein